MSDENVPSGIGFTWGNKAGHVTGLYGIVLLLILLIGGMMYEFSQQNVKYLMRLYDMQNATVLYKDKIIEAQYQTIAAQAVTIKKCADNP